jgi:hypothetical protein
MADKDTREKGVGARLLHTARGVAVHVFCVLFVSL